MNQTQIEKPLQWHKERQKKIGGSDVGAILGLSPYKTPLDVYNEKMADEPIVTPLSAAMEFGLILEDSIAFKYERDTGLKLNRKNRDAVHSKFPYMAAQIDRLIVGAPAGTGVLEIKTASGFAVKSWGEDGLPLNYYAQLQYQMACGNYSWGDIALLIDGRNFHVFPFQRDNEFIAIMENQVSEFWEKHILAGIPPEPVNESDLKTLFPQSDPEARLEAPPETLEVLRELESVKNRLKGLSDEKDALEFKIKALMGKAEILEFAGDVLATWKTTQSERLDTKQLQKELPDIYARYVKPSISRRFLPKSL